MYPVELCFSFFSSRILFYSIIFSSHGQRVRDNACFGKECKRNRFANDFGGGEYFFYYRFGVVLEAFVTAGTEGNKRQPILSV